MTVIFFSASPHLCDCDYLFLSAFISLVYLLPVLCHPLLCLRVTLSQFHFLSSSLPYFPYFCCTVFIPFAFFISLLSLLVALSSIRLLSSYLSFPYFCCTVSIPFGFFIHALLCLIVALSSILLLSASLVVWSLSLLLFVSFTPGFKFVTQFPHFDLTLIIANVVHAENTSSNLCARPLAQPKTSQFKIGIFR